MGIYLDYAATSPIRPAIWEAVAEFLERHPGNPSSLHEPGRRARMALEEAREKVACRLHSRVEEIVFTSGATESNNLAIFGVMNLAPAKSWFLHSAVEHPSVAECGPILERQGFHSGIIPVDRQGVVNLEWLEDKLEREKVGLVSVMAVNNEVGTIQPVEKVLALTRRYTVPCHVDAVQAVPGGLREVLACGADLLSLSGHKLGGLPGSGLLRLRHDLPLAPSAFGGSQEDSRRPGTPNLPGILALAQALEIALQEDPRRTCALRERLEAQLSLIPDAQLLAKDSPRAAHISAWLFGELPAESLLVALDLEGVAASSGSACSSHSVEASRVLMGMGYTEGNARGLVRLSLGWNSTAQDVRRAAEIITKVAGGRRPHNHERRAAV